MTCVEGKTNTERRNTEGCSYDPVYIGWIEHLDTQFGWHTWDYGIGIDADFRFSVDWVFGSVDGYRRSEYLAEAADQLAIDKGFHIHDWITILW
jgi:hypothetical protein